MSLPLKTTTAVDVANAECYGAAECAREIAEGDDAGNAHRTLVETIPDCDEVDNA